MKKHSRKSGSNTRNGYTSKRLLTHNGEFELETPRDRDGTFEPALIKKNQTRITSMDSQILSLYAKGMTTREKAFPKRSIRYDLPRYPYPAMHSSYGSQ